jgi:hypothetical protein
MKSTTGVGGWLLVLCALLLVVHPLALAIVSSNALDSVTMRGLPSILTLVLRIGVCAVGIAAGLALAQRRSGAVGFAKASLAASALTDVFVYSTPYFPGNRMPGDTPLYILGSLAYYGVWLMYLVRSRRVKETYREAA